MSYILEALKKSERDRQRKSVPDLHTVHETPPAKTWKRTRLPMLLALILLVNGALAIFLLLDRQHNVKMTVPQEETAGQDGPLSPANPAEGQSRSLVAATSSMREQVKGPGAEPTTPDASQGMRQDSALEDIAATGQLAAGKERLTPVQGNDGGEGRVQAEAQTIVQLETTQLPDDSSSVEPEADFSSDQQDAEPEQQEDSLALINDSPEPPGPVPTGKTGTDREQEIPFIDKLPAFVKSGLPEISISFHVYAQKPAARLVSINGKILREGQEVAAGLKLEEITAEGVILNYKGDRFRMKVF